MKFSKHNRRLNLLSFLYGCFLGNDRFKYAPEKFKNKRDKEIYQYVTKEYSELNS